MEVTGLCAICGRTAKLYTCSLCGRLVCSHCINPEKRICIQCLGGRGGQLNLKPDRRTTRSTDIREM